MDVSKDKLNKAATLLQKYCSDMAECSPEDCLDCPFVIHGGACDICALTGDNPEHWEL